MLVLTVPFFRDAAAQMKEEVAEFYSTKIVESYWTKTKKLSGDERLNRW